MNRKQFVRILAVVTLLAIFWWITQYTDSFLLTTIIMIFMAITVAIAIATWIIRNRAGARSWVLRRAALSRRGWNSGAIQTSGTLLFLTIVVGAVFGLLLYVDRVHHFQSDLRDAYCRTDVVGRLLASEPDGFLAKNVRLSPNARGDCSTRRIQPTGDVVKELTIDSQRLYKLLRHVGLLSSDEVRGGPKALEMSRESEADSSTLPNRTVAKVMLDPEFGKRYTIGTPTINLVIDLSESASAGRQDKWAELEWIQTAMGSFLARAPSDWAWSPLPLWASVEQPNRCVDTDEELCRTLYRNNLSKLKLNLLDGAIAELPDEMSAYELANLVNRWSRPPTRVPASGASQVLSDVDGDTLAANEAIPRLQAALIDALRNDDSVRKARVFVNAIVGPERALIIILAMWFIVLTLSRSIQALPHLAHRVEIQRWMAYLESQWRDSKVDAAVRLAAARNLFENLRNGNEITEQFLKEIISPRPAANQTEKPTSAPHVVTIPSRLLEAAIEEMTSRDTTSSKPPDAQAIETVAKSMRNEIDHSRLIFEILLPTFPAVGFVATVSSLLVAMSKADQIVKAFDAMGRGMATSAVTDTLSLCFATTFMALICLIVLTPLSMWQGDAENQLIDETEADLQRVLRPEQS